MAAHRKIGLLTFHRCINYGSYWQARCLVDGLSARGNEVVLLDHDCPSARLAEWRCSFQPLLPQRTPRQDFGPYKAKVRKFTEAVSGLPRSPCFSLHQPEAAGDYDAIVVGSDEVWNFRHPWYGGKPIFFGSGLKSDRLIAYAASFGNHDSSYGIPHGWERQFRNFAAISVRDDNSRALIQTALGTAPEIVLDPCLQFPPDLQSTTAVNGERYALVYGHSFPKWLKASAVRWSRASGIKLLSVGYRNPWTHREEVSAGPGEFAELMAGASAVITNFFHGCVFALLGRKPFVSVASAYRFNKVSNLTSLLGAQSRLIGEQTSDRTILSLLAEPPSDVIFDRVSALRERSDTYLRAALP